MQFYFIFLTLLQCCSNAILMLNENLNVICKVISKMESFKFFVMFVCCQVLRKCRIKVYLYWEFLKVHQMLQQWLQISRDPEQQLISLLHLTNSVVWSYLSDNMRKWVHTVRALYEYSLQIHKRYDNIYHVKHLLELFKLLHFNICL